MKIAPIEDNSTNFTLVELKTDRENTFITPHCKVHGAMNKVSVHNDGGGYWRCCTCDGVICRAGCNQIKTKKLKLWHKLLSQLLKLKNFL